MLNKKIVILILVISLLLSSAYYGYQYYISQKKTTIIPSDAQIQIDYAQQTKQFLDQKPFTDKLPYVSDNFEVYYNSDVDEVQIFMKNKGLTFQNAQKADTADVNTFLQKIGVDPKKQKVTWFLEQ